MKQGSRRVHKVSASIAKVILSTEQTTRVQVASLVGSKGLDVQLSRRKFEALCRGLLLRMVQPMREAARMADITLDESNWGTLKQADLAPKAVQRWQKQVPRGVSSIDDSLMKHQQ